MKNHGHLKWTLSLEPGYQVIYWSLCWLSFLVGVIAWLEITVFNWITVIFWLITLFFLLIAKTHHLCLKNGQLIFSFLKKNKQFVPLKIITKITYSTNRSVVLIDCNEKKLIRFFLKPTSQKSFLSYISSHYPNIQLEETKSSLEK